jgi:uroporphyrinogen decarboxylase
VNAKTRFLAALRNEMPDRVPVAPDISNMIPCRLTGKPFWEIYLHGDPPLWRAHLDANRRFGFDAWFYRGSLDLETDATNTVTRTIVERTEERIVRETRIANRCGEISQQTAYYVADSPWVIGKWIVDPVSDIPCYLESQGRIVGHTTRTLDQMREAIGGEFALGFRLNYPGFHYWINLFEGGLLQIMDLHRERPDLLEQLRAFHHQRTVDLLERILPYDPDYVFIGASGTLTLASPALFRQYGLPTLKAITETCHARGVPTLLHSCGKAKALVEICSRETHLSCINPLETPPMGDCVLAEIKARYGHALALMGNLHTTDVMLNGSPREVAAAARQAIDDAGAGGGFILSTGDQCGRDTPLRNLEILVETAERYGTY